MGRKYVIDKIMSALAGTFSVVIMFFAVMFAIVREGMWLYIVVAGLTCPLWHWLLRKYILKEQLLKLWIIRGSAILLGCAVLTIANYYTPYYKCMDIMVNDRMNTLYEETIKTDSTELIEVTDVKRELFFDYYKITATIHYEDKKTEEKKSEDRVLYFDRMKGQYFASFDNMRKYRQEYWKYTDDMELCMFDQEEVMGTVRKFTKTLADGNFKEAKKMMGETLRSDITEEKWKEWVELIKDRGGISGTVDSLKERSYGYEIKNSERIGQMLVISWNLGTADGETVFRGALGEDMLFRQLEI